MMFKVLDAFDPRAGIGRIGLVAMLPVAPLIVLGNPAIALLAGGTLSVALNRTLYTEASSLSRISLQTAIVLLGFRMNLGHVLELSASYALIVGGFVVFTLLLGLLLGRLLAGSREYSALIASGTAICGGTTIASLSPVIRASSAQTGMALTIVFLLNAVALFTFPSFGKLLGMSQEAFGVWVSMAIHDTSSVVATAAIYGDGAAETAATLKLGRTLWLIPVLFTFALIEGQRSASLRLPAFIVFFLAASLIGSVFRVPDAVDDGAGIVSSALLVLALYCVGMEITRETLRGLSGRVLVQPLLLWVIVVGSTLAFSLLFV